MQPKAAKDDRAHLYDMLDSAQKATSYVREQTFDQFWDDFKTRDAVAMRLTIIGEAARQVSAATAAQIPTVPFHRIRGLRNRIAHSYDQVDFREVWKITQHDLQPLITELEKYFREIQRQEAPQSQEKHVPQTKMPPPDINEGSGPRISL